MKNSMICTASGLAGSRGSNSVIRTVSSHLWALFSPVRYLEASFFFMVIPGSSRLELHLFSNLNGKGNFAFIFLKVNHIGLAYHVTIPEPIWGHGGRIH